MEVCNIVQEAVIKTIYKIKKERQNSCLRRSYKYLRRETKGNREKGKYTHLNSEFQRRARKDEKSFLSEQCKEIEGKNRMGKTGDLFKKIRDSKEKFHVKIGTIKNGNGTDLI